MKQAAKYIQNTANIN